MNVSQSVELWSGHIPLIGWYAHHHWLVTVQGGKRDRWEVWQSRGMCSESWGYLHKNLMAPEEWIGRHAPHLVAEWTRDKARELIEKIESSPETYPWIERYRYWPGPNSNTYVQWILAEVYDLGNHAPGKRYGRASNDRRK